MDEDLNTDDNDPGESVSGRLRVSTSKDSEIEEIKEIFKQMIESGERYDLDDIESWFENEGSWKDKNSRVRIINLAHYVQNKYQQTLKLNIVSDDDCSCGN